MVNLADTDGWHKAIETACDVIARIASEEAGDYTRLAILFVFSRCVRIFVKEIIR